MNKSPETDKSIWNIRSNKGNYENPVSKTMTNVRLGMGQRGFDYRKTKMPILEEIL